MHSLLGATVCAALPVVCRGQLVTGALADACAATNTLVGPSGGVPNMWARHTACIRTACYAEWPWLAWQHRLSLCLISLGLPALHANRYWGTVPVTSLTNLRDTCFSCRHDLVLTQSAYICECVDMQAGEDCCWRTSPPVSLLVLVCCWVW